MCLETAEVPQCQQQRRRGCIGAAYSSGHSGSNGVLSPPHHFRAKKELTLPTCRYPVAVLAKQRDGGYEQMKETSLCFLQIDVMVVNAAKSL